MHRTNVLINTWTGESLANDKWECWYANGARLIGHDWDADKFPNPLPDLEGIRFLLRSWGFAKEDHWMIHPESLFVWIDEWIHLDYSQTPPKMDVWTCELVEVPAWQRKQE